MGISLYVIYHFSLVAFNILSLSLIFVSLIHYVSWCVPSWVYPAWDSALLGLFFFFFFFFYYFLSHVREVFSYYFFKLGFGLVGRAMLSQPLIQLSTDGQGWASSLLLVQSEATNPVLRKDLCQGTLSRTAVASAPISMASNCPPIPPQETLQHQQVGLVQPALGLLLLFPGS